MWRMPNFSLKRLLATVTLIAIGCGEIAYLRSPSRPPGPMNALDMLSLFSCVSILSAGILTPFKQTLLGAWIGILLFAALLLYGLWGLSHG
jgi:hypothetical protein